LIHTCGFWVRANNAEQDLVVVGDVTERDAYRVEQLPMPRPVVVDVGAHIGCFSRKIHRRNPLARIIAVECCPKNIPVLKKNVGDFATVVQAAVTYERDVALLSAVYPHCTSTGGSAVLPRREIERRVAEGMIFPEPGPGRDTEFWADFRPLKTVTLEQILEEQGLDQIDILKLDCEESEYSILRNTTILDRIGIIVGEYHHKSPFMKLVEERFSGWNLRILKDGELGTFWLMRRRYRLQQFQQLQQLLHSRRGVRQDGRSQDGHPPGVRRRRV
jgi:FkbM family methyltransferase